MSTNERSKSVTASMTSDGPVPACPPGTVFNPKTGTCEESGSPQEVVAFSEIQGADESLEEK